MRAYLKDFMVSYCPLPRWLRRVGAAGFFFFLIKGLLWLAFTGYLLMMGYQA